MNRFEQLEFHDFELMMRNRERLLISEISLERVSDHDVREFLMHCRPERVPLIHRDVIDAAARGYDTEFTAKLSSPPHVVLAKLGATPCAMNNACSNYDVKNCRANAFYKSEVAFPICYEYGSADPIERFVLTEFSKKWRDRRIVIICPN